MATRAGGMRPGGGMRARARVRWLAAVAAGVLAGGLVAVAPAGADHPAGVPVAPGYWLLGRDGGVFTFGASGFFGSAVTTASDCPANPPGRDMPGGSCLSMAPTPDGQGYWVLNGYDGRIFPFGDAVSYGQPADTAAFQGPADLWPTAVDLVPTPDGRGYWVLEAGPSGLGTVQAFGDATFYGDELTVAGAGGHVGTPVAMAATRDGHGYWIVDSDGGVFSFGDATFAGSMGGRTLNAPVVGVAATADGQGYWLAASDGGVFAFGDAPFGGSMATVPLVRPVVGIAADRSGSGYWLAASDGGVFALGGAPFLGSMGGQPLAAPVVAVTAPAPARPV